MGTSGTREQAVSSRVMLLQVLLVRADERLISTSLFLSLLLVRQGYYGSVITYLFLSFSVRFFRIMTLQYGNVTLIRLFEVLVRGDESVISFSFLCLPFHLFGIYPAIFVLFKALVRGDEWES